MGLSVSTVDRSIKAFLYGNVSLGVLAMKYYQNEWMLYSSLALTAGYSFVEDGFKKWLGKNLIVQRPVDNDAIPSRVFHDIKRTMTYPSTIPNTWYHLCDSKDVKPGQVVEVRALNQDFAVWRGEDGVVHCQEAYCLHLGANIAVGGTVEGNTIVCPFHRWRFEGDGTVAEVPYLKDPKNCPTHTKLKTYHCKEFCGWICIYYHANQAPTDPPVFDLPSYIQDEITNGGWKPHLQWDIGFLTTNVVDWVDQVGDHAHFHMLHTEFMIPWTLIKLPQWLLKIFPIGIRHNLTTYIGDDKDWIEEIKKTQYGYPERHFVMFYDEAALTWNGKIMENTKAKTLETYVGPALVVFNVPFAVGAFKVLFSTLPVEGGCIMRIRTMIDRRVQDNYWKQWIAWLLAGISASQLMLDAHILSNKIRLRRPVLQPFDGPYNRVSGWLKNFYSENSPSNALQCTSYNNDW